MREHQAWQERARDVLPAEMRSRIERSWCRETAFDPRIWTLANPARGQCAVTAALIHEMAGLPVCRGRATLPDSRIESFYWNAGADLTGRQYPADTIVRPYGDVQGDAAYRYLLQNADLVGRLVILRQRFACLGQYEIVDDSPL